MVSYNAMVILSTQGRNDQQPPHRRGFLNCPLDIVGGRSCKLGLVGSVIRGRWHVEDGIGSSKAEAFARGYVSLCGLEVRVVDELGWCLGRVTVDSNNAQVSVILQEGSDCFSARLCRGG